MAEQRLCVVLDTDVLISGILFKGQTVRQVLTRAVDDCPLVFSEATWDELSRVLQRPAFGRYMPLETRLQVLLELAGRVEVVKVQTGVQVCRDPKGDMFLALALDARARYLVSGGQELLALHPFHGLAIVSPSAFWAA